MGYIDVNRLGHGGHSYGAFTTGNLLAHTPFFKAGIAGDGAYNRTLTPMTFQGERRNFWDAPTTYMEMSSFFYADQIKAPLLMYHGEKDNNSGTFIIQSERMMQALTGLGQDRGALHLPVRIARAAREGELPRPLGALARVVRQVRQERAARAHDHGSTVGSLTPWAAVGLTITWGWPFRFTPIYAGEFLWKGKRYKGHRPEHGKPNSRPFGARPLDTSAPAGTTPLTD